MLRLSEEFPEDMTPTSGALDSDVSWDQARQRARATAISYIGISQKSSGKVNRYLVHKGIEPSVAQEVVQGLSEDGYIDDLRVARGIIGTRQGRKAESRRALRQRLYYAGISEYAIELAYDDMPTDELLIQQLVDQKLRKDFAKLFWTCDHGENEQDEGTPEVGVDVNLWVNKSMRFLLSRGFSQSLALNALHKLIHEVE